MIDFQTFGSVSEASSSLTSDTRFFAGGTLLMRDINYGAQAFNRLVASSDPALKDVQASGDEIRIGAGVTMREILSNPQLDFLQQVARSIGGPAIRNMATIGGNLFAPRPYGDMATAFLALGASIHWSNGSIQSIDDFIVQPPTPNQIVSSIVIPRPASGGFRYLKVSRVKPKGVSLISIALFMNREGGRIGSCRLAFGGMAPTARRAEAAEKALSGASLDENGIRAALSVCTDGMEPADDALASAWYRNEVAPVYLQRLLLQRS